jgi:hypothetical protein
MRGGRLSKLLLWSGKLLEILFFDPLQAGGYLAMYVAPSRSDTIIRIAGATTRAPAGALTICDLLH